MPVETMSAAAAVPSAMPAPSSAPSVPVVGLGPAPHTGSGAGGRAPGRPTDRPEVLARSIVRALARALPRNTPLSVVMDGGAVDRASLPAPAPGHARLRIHGPGALARMVPPTENALADAFLRGDLDIEGDVAVAIEAARDLDLRRLSATDARQLGRWSWELRRARSGDLPAPLARSAARLNGSRHSRARDLEAIRFHYDVGEAFYGLWLDRRLAYSCAYFERDDDPARDLDPAQEAKLDLVCRKLDLRPGQRLLDIGCGWGSLILYARSATRSTWSA